MPLSSGPQRMQSRFISVTFVKKTGKWCGYANTLKAAERAGLPDHLREMTMLTTDSHEDEEDAACAVDK